MPSYYGMLEKAHYFGHTEVFATKRITAYLTNINLRIHCSFVTIKRAFVKTI